MKTQHALLALFAALILPATSIAQSAENAQRVLSQRGSYGLTMEFDGSTLRVSGCHSVCGIMIGLQKCSYVLPGDAQVSVKPLYVLSGGRFNADGSWEFDLGSLMASLKEPLTVYLQAISVVDAKGFKTSAPIMLGIATEKMQGPRVQPTDRAVGSAAAARTQPVLRSENGKQVQTGAKTQPVLNK